jgi:thioester reductase-like protein
MAPLLAQSPMKNQTFSQTVFLTGATGILGGRILKDLLQKTSSQIFCLARGETPAHCRERVQNFLLVYDKLGELQSEFETRVVVLQGDIAQDQLGLSLEVYKDLQSKVELTIHAAANTSLLVKYDHLEPTNVHGTGRVIEFCLGSVGKQLSYISTFTVMGDKTFDPEFKFSENDFELGQGFNDMNYQRSKFTAEGMVRKATQRGLKWRIFRPGQIYGDSQTGAYPQGETRVSGLFYDMFKTAMDTKMMPKSYSHYDLVPVDYVSAGIVALSAQEQEFFQVYHLTNPDIKSFVQVIGLLQEQGYPIELLPEEIYKTKLRAGEIRKNGESYSSNTLKALSLWYFISKISFNQSAVTDCQFTKSKLEKLGVACAPIDRKLIETYVQTGIREGYLPRPEMSL